MIHCFGNTVSCNSACSISCGSEVFASQHAVQLCNKLGHTLDGGLLTGLYTMLMSSVRFSNAVTIDENTEELGPKKFNMEMVWIFYNRHGANNSYLQMLQ